MKKYRLERIIGVVDEFLRCSDYKEGIARAPISLKKLKYEPFKCEVPLRVKIVAVIQDPEEIREILRHLIKVCRPISILLP